MHTLFAVAGSVVNFVACLSYVRAILKGEAAPNRVTWSLWTIVPSIAGAAQLRAGVGISTLVVLSVGVGPACVVLASFVRHRGSWKLGPFDYFCGAYALAALALWAMTGDPVIAIVLSMLGDFARRPSDLPQGLACTGNRRPAGLSDRLHRHGAGPLLGRGDDVRRLRVQCLSADGIGRPRLDPVLAARAQRRHGAQPGE